jgi:orotidine-5'-phosphate decarboxylase
MMFLEKLLAAIETNRSPLCIGLDPDLDRLPAHLPRTPAGVVMFNQAIIAATADLVCAYKPNIAFYEALGAAGWEALQATLQAIPPHIPTILDAKRGDIGSTAQAYARAAFDELKVDAITLSPYLGGDALAPFLERKERGCFILCRTSNPGGSDLQDQVLANGEPLYTHVARLAAERWNEHGNCGLVVGATYPSELAAVRAICPGLPLLVPGVGTQGGDLAAALAAGGDRTIISVSRAVIYAGSGPDFAAHARQAAYDLRALK